MPFKTAYGVSSRELARLIEKHEIIESSGNPAQFIKNALNRRA